MALDAATLSLCAAELQDALQEARIDKVHQPTRDEVVLAMRSRSSSHRLLLSARNGSARACLTRESYENPASPPTFCMLLRKHLTGGRLLNVRTLPGERIAFFDFLCTNELGDLVCLSLAAELMGRYCNLVLVRNDGVLADNRLDAGALAALYRPVAPGAAPAQAATGAGASPTRPKIIDALKRVDFEDSEIRQLLPGLWYTLPPMPAKLDFLTAPRPALFGQLATQEAPVADALRRVLGGVGPVIARQAAFLAFGAAEVIAARLGADEQEALWQAIEAIRADYRAGGVPNLVRKADGLPVEFSFTRLTQYLPAGTLEAYDGFSALLEGYYAEKDRIERLRQKSKQLRRTVANLYERAVRKQAARQEDLAQSEKSEGLRVAGELLTANLHAFKKGDASVRLLNWYTGQEETIRLDPRLGPSQNAQRYFKEYKKKQTAARMLAQLLEKGEKEVAYLETVLYEVDGAAGEGALGEIRAELKGQGYLKYYKQRDKKQKPADFMRYTSSDGFAMLVGRNNTQNERLTLKTARGKDLWFHTKNAPGSHVVVMSEGRDIPLATQNEAAMLAVWHSSQRHGAQVPVDYTQVKHIRKTGDLPPGMVLYEHYETAYVTPDETMLARLEAARADKPAAGRR